VPSRGTRAEVLHLRLKIKAKQLGDFALRLARGEVLDREACGDLEVLGGHIVRDCGELDGLEDREQPITQHERADDLIDEVERAPLGPGRSTPGEKPSTRSK